MPETAPHTPDQLSGLTPEAATQIEKQPKFDFEELRQTLSDQVEQLQKQFKVKHRHLLRWAAKQGYTLHFLTESTSKVAVSAGLIGSLLAGAPQGILHADSAAPSPEPTVVQTQTTTESDRHKAQLTAAALQQQKAQYQQQLQQQLWALGQKPASTINTAQAADLVSQLTGVAATDQLEGYRLNTNLGRIGAEQHLRLYPGQSLAEHFASPQLQSAYQSSGFAPGNGAYGYFASSKATATQEQINREKYYVAIQTFLSPNWSGNVSQAYNWFRYRKLIIYSPTTNQAVVAVVGDAGPALSTGKNYGGSPEVMAALSARDGYGSPPVMAFFVNDPDNTIPLGPVDFKVVLDNQ